MTDQERPVSRRRESAPSTSKDDLIGGMTREQRLTRAAQLILLGVTRLAEERMKARLEQGEQTDPTNPEPDSGL